MIRAVGFDLGDTLLFYRDTPMSWAAMYPDALAAVAKGCDATPTAEQLARAKEILTQHNTRAVPRTHEVPAESIFTSILKAWALDPVKHINAAIEAYFTFFQQRMSAYPETVEVLQTLRAKGFPTGILTDVAYGMPRTFVQRDISGAGITNLFDVLLTSVEVGVRKPEPAGYRELAKRLNVEPNQMLYIGNEPKDVIGAKAAGARSAFLDRENSGAKHGQDFTCSTLSDIHEILARRLNQKINPAQRMFAARTLMKARHWLLWLAIGMLTSVAAELPVKLKPIPACPTLIASAKSNHILLEGVESSASMNNLRPGDHATVLATFVQKKKQQQWLLHLQIAAPNAAKTNEPTATFVVKSSFGDIQFKSRIVPMQLQMFGPFDPIDTNKPAKVNVTKSEFAVTEDFLALGLDQPAALLHRWGQTTNFSGPVTSKALLALNPTPDEQRAICATFPALMSYFNIVQHNDGLEDLLYKLIETPSLWSLIKHRGVDVNISFGNDNLPLPASSTDWHVPAATPIYYFPWQLSLNDKPALKITLVATSPKPPLLICGGVTALLVEKIGDNETYMTLRVLSAKATGPKTANESN
ncbi:MAG: HAD family hydrolase [Verrucomicrobiota bacterium]